MRRMRFGIAVVCVPLLFGAMMLWGILTESVRAESLATEYPVATCDEMGLTDAVDLANADPSGGIVTFAVCPVPALIILNDQITVFGDVTIDGLSRLFLRAGINERHFMVQTGGKLTLIGIALQDGRGVTVGGSIQVANGGALHTRSVLFHNNSTDTVGGAIHAFGAEIALTDTTFLSNTAGTLSGALYLQQSRADLENVHFMRNHSSFAGAISAIDTALEIRASEFLSNYAESSGAALELTNGVSDTARLTVTGTSFVGNRAATSEGAISVTNAEYLVRGSFFSQNVARSASAINAFNSSGRIERSLFLKNGDPLTTTQGAALYLYDSDTDIVASQFVSNTAENAGGAISIVLTADMHGSVEVVASTFAGNLAEEGAAIHINQHDEEPPAPFVNIKNSTFDGNGGALPQSSTIHAQSTLLTLDHLSITRAPLALSAAEDATLQVANSTLQNDVECALATGATIAIQHSLLGSGTCGSMGTGMIVDSTTMLAPLQDYGGFTRTRHPLPGSAIIDAADSGACLPTDQRGVPRPQGAGCDMGAVEVTGNLLPTLTPTPIPPTPTPIPTFATTGTPTATAPASLTPDASLTPNPSMTPNASSTPNASLTPEAPSTPGDYKLFISSVHN